MGKTTRWCKNGQTRKINMRTITNTHSNVPCSSRARPPSCTKAEKRAKYIHGPQQKIAPKNIRKVNSNGRAYGKRINNKKSIKRVNLQNEYYQQKGLQSYDDHLAPTLLATVTRLRCKFNTGAGAMISNF